MANKKISELPLATGVTGANVVPVVVGVTTSRVPLSTLSSFFSAAGPTGATGPQGAGAIYQSDVAPSVAPAGATWLDTATGKYFVRYSALWIEVGGKHYP